MSQREKWDAFVNLRKKDELMQCETSDSDTNDDDCLAKVQSKELYEYLTNNDRVQVPAGHSVLVANSKNREYEQFSANGRPVMDKLGRDFMQDILLMDA